MENDDAVFHADQGGKKCSDSRVPTVFALATLGTLVLGAFVCLLVVLDGLQQEAADHATTVALDGALHFTTTAVGAVFDETRVLALRLARDRQSGRSPTCANSTASMDDMNYPLAATMNASTTPVFAAYDTLQPPGVPQASGALTYTMCGAFKKNVAVYHPSPPRVLAYAVGTFPQNTVGAMKGNWGPAWNQTAEPYVKHIRTLRRGSPAFDTGAWAAPGVWKEPGTSTWTLYMSAHFPVAYDGPTDEPSAAVSVDLRGDGLRPLLESVDVDRTRAVLLDPRMDPAGSLPASATNGVLLASSFGGVPSLRNDSGVMSLWAADATPNRLLNAAVQIVAALVPGGLREMTSSVEISGPEATVIGAAPVIRPGGLHLVVILVTPRSVFDGKLQHGRKISAGVGSACAVVCVVALCSLVLLTNSAARGLLKHVVAGSGRNVQHAPTDETQPFAMVFTDIQSSTAMWARLPQHMGHALDLHHTLIRRCIEEHNGYEVKTIGDSFMVAFKDPADSVLFALAVQTALVSAEWETSGIDWEYDDLIPSMYPDHKHLATDAPGYTQLWAGLRVRVGVHYGTGSIVHDEVIQGYDYYGTVVNTAARVEGVAHGGQVLLTQAAMDAVSADTAELPLPQQSACFGQACVENLGPQILRGLDDPVTLIQVLPGPIEGRTFPPLRLDVEIQVDAPEESHGGSTAGTRSDVGQARKPSAAGGSSYVASSDESSFEATWRRHKVGALGLRQYVLCCEAVRTIMGPLPDTQRTASLRTLARKWRVAMSARSGDAFSDDMLIATVLAKAAHGIAHRTKEKVSGGGLSTTSRGESRVSATPSTVSADPRRTSAAAHGSTTAVSPFLITSPAASLTSLPVPELRRKSAS